QRRRQQGNALRDHLDPGLQVKADVLRKAQVDEALPDTASVRRIMIAWQQMPDHVLLAAEPVDGLSKIPIRHVRPVVDVARDKDMLCAGLARHASDASDDIEACLAQQGHLVSGKTGEGPADLPVGRMDERERHASIMFPLCSHDKRPRLPRPATLGISSRCRDHRRFSRSAHQLRMGRAWTMNRPDARRRQPRESMSTDVETIIVGAGVVGLAIARSLAEAGQEVLVLEQHGLIGSETSSRNSEVIHAGIYYPPGSLRARLCVAGKERLYRFCAENGVSHERCGKLLVATAEEQLPRLKA